MHEEPIHIHLLGTTNRSCAVGDFITRAPGLELVKYDTNAELLFVETSDPPIGGILLRRLNSGKRLIAVEFLTQPYQYSAFLQATQRAREQMLNTSAPSKHNPLHPTAPHYFFVKSEYRMVRIDCDRILYVEGMKNYAKIFLTGESKPVITLTSLKALIEKLPDNEFVRVHKSFIAHLRYIRSVERGIAWIGSARIPIADKQKTYLSARLNPKTRIQEH